MIDWYPWLKTLHVLLAIVAVGANVTYGIWQARAARDPQHLGWTPRGVKFIDDRVANPAYIALALVGVLLVIIGPWEFEQLWVVLAIGLYIILGLVGFALYTPTLSRQIRVFEADGSQSSEFASLTIRSRILGAVLGVVVLLIVMDMVVKPGI